MSDIKFKATVDSKKGEVSLKELDKGVGKVEKSTKKAGAGFKQLAVGVAAGVAAFAVATKALQGLVRWTGESIKGAIDAEKAEKKLEVVLKSTGEAAGLTKDELVEMAKALQAVTTYEDDVIMGAEHLLLTFTNIGKEVFPDALETVLNMAQAMGTDLRGASIQLGKALQDPILGATALRRVGVNLSKSMMEQIKVFVESGNIMGAQRLILEELATEFGGTARAVTETFGGSLIQLKNTFRELQDEVGETIIANEEFKDLIQLTQEAVRDLIDSGAIRWFTDIAIQAVKSAPMLRSLSESLALVALIFKMQAEEQKKASETTQEWIKHLQIEDDLQKSLREQIAGVIEVTEEQAEVTEKVVTQIQILSMVKIDWEALKPPSELIAEWETLFALVETPELDLAFEQFAISAEDNYANVMESMGFFVREHGEGVDTVTKQTKKLSMLEQVALAEMSTSYQGIIGTILSVIEKWAIGEIVKSVMIALPFPANLLATAGAIAAVKAIFAALAPKEAEGKAEGGWVGLQGEEVVRVGERGPEYITPNRMLGPLAPARKVEATFQANFFITSPDALGVRDFVRDKAGPEFIAWVKLNKTELLEALDME